MTLVIAAALALSGAPTAGAEGTPVESNLEYVMPIAGGWTFATTADGSEATFANSSKLPQVAIRCVRSTRKIAILKVAPSPSPSLWVWTSSDKKSLPASFDATTGRVVAELSAYDPLLDAIASSRGRIGFSTSGLAALVVPPWAEVARVIEDCRV